VNALDYVIQSYSRTSDLEACIDILLQTGAVRGPGDRDFE
jgi:hypothetical protein